MKKKPFISFTDYTTLERKGIVALCLILTVLVLIRFLLPVLVKPPQPTEEDKKYLQAWEAYKQQQKTRHSQEDSTRKAQSSFADHSEAGTAPLPDEIDLNTADSTILVRLKGIGPKTASKILSNRARIGKYHSVANFQQRVHLNQPTFERLKKHLVAQ